jgi:hypothetical protein
MRRIGIFGAALVTFTTTGFAPREGPRPVNGLVAFAEVVEQTPPKAPAYFEVRFRLKNTSDKPITICDYVGNRPLEVRWTGPDGKTLKSTHYDWLRAADIAGLSAKNFVTIPPGGIRRLGPQGENSGIVFQPVPEKPFRFGNVAALGQHRLVVSYVNREDGRKFKLENVWTGSVTADEVTFLVK